MMSIFAAIMVPMIATFLNMRFVFRVELQFDAHVLDDPVQSPLHGYQLQLQLFPASPFDIVESKETSSRCPGQHLHVHGVLLRGRYDVPSEVFHDAWVLLLLRHDAYCHTFPGPLLLLVFQAFLPIGWKDISQGVAILGQFRPTLNLLPKLAVLSNISPPHSQPQPPTFQVEKYCQ